MNTVTQRLAAATCAVIAAGSVTACFNATNGATPVNEASDLKIALFDAGSGNTYLQAGDAGAKAEAAKVGASIDIFDGKFDAQTQFNQIQTALTSGKYNAFIVEPNDGKQLCNILTKNAAEKHILVVAATGALCGRDTKPGDGIWEPGTVAYVGGQAPGVYDAWVRRVMTDFPNGADIAVLTGPTINANTTNVNNALKLLASKPGYKVVAEQATDYTPAQGYAAAQTILRSHPDINVILSNYSGMTQGVVKAVQESGRASKIKVYDVGGNTWALNAVKSGQLAATVVLYPRDEMIAAVDALADAANGKPSQHFIDMSKSPSLPGTNTADATNVTKFHAQY